MRIIDKLFRLEEINGHNICPTYLYRWTLMRWGKLCAVYVHHFVGDDWALDLHDHPKRFISVGLRGGYVEQTRAGERTYRAPWVRSFPAEHTHRLRMLRPGAECWTLVIVLRARRDWGFWKDGRFVSWRDYVRPGVSRPACD